ncbi:MAG: AraC family transcriptional regulator [Spirochaetia bacterium]|nr:AraC family transcriptional regulator [Spirochaetia bacterium]
MASLPVELQSSSSSADLLVFKMADAVLSKDEKHLMEFAQELLIGPEVRERSELEMRHFLLTIMHKVIAQVYSISEVQVSHLYREIGYPIQQEAGGGLQQAKHEFITCLSRFFDYFQANLTSRNERLLSQVKLRIAEQYARAISLEGLSSEIGLSPSYLSRLFKSLEGINLKDYILNIRVDKAKQALLEGKTVEQAGSETGFSDPAYFTKCFKRVVGLTPREYVQEKKRLS